MANIIALIIFIGSFCSIAFLVFKKRAILANLPEQSPKEEQIGQSRYQIKKDILQKGAVVRQAVLRNRGARALMAKASGFKMLLTSRKMTPEEAEKVEKIHQEGDYWQKVGERQLIASRGRFRRSSAEPLKIAPGEHKFPSKKRQEVEPQPKKPRVRKKKTE